MSNALLINEPPLQVLPSLACEVGLNAALVLQQFHYWLQRSDNIKDGHKWIYNSYSEWHKQFPFWKSKNTLISAIKHLEDMEILVSGNYNKAKFDKTKWYRIDYSKLQSLENSQPFTKNWYTKDQKMVNGETKNWETNTNRLPENTTENNKRNKKESSDDLSGQTSLTDRFEKLWKQYPKKQGKQAAFRAYKRAVKKGTEDKDIELGIVNYKKYIKVKRIDNQFIKQGSTWFNQGCWEDEYDLGNQDNQQKERQWLF